LHGARLLRVQPTTYEGRREHQQYEPLHLD
jgi:hypothetical protein